MKHMYSLAALLLFMLPASAQQEGRVITEEPLCLCPPILYRPANPENNCLSCTPAIRTAV